MVTQRLKIQNSLQVTPQTITCTENDNLMGLQVHNPVSTPISIKTLLINGTGRKKVNRLARNPYANRFRTDFDFLQNLIYTTPGKCHNFFGVLSDFFNQNKHFSERSDKNTRNTFVQFQSLIYSTKIAINIYFLKSNTYYLDRNMLPFCQLCKYQMKRHKCSKQYSNLLRKTEL